MTKLQYFASILAAALLYTACIENAQSKNAIMANTVEKIAPTGPSKLALVKLEMSAFQAWKAKDAQFWDAFLSDKFVGWGSFGRLGKASAKMEYTGADCEINSYALSNEQVSALGKSAALITYKETVSGTCGGQMIPDNSWVAGNGQNVGPIWGTSIYAKDGGTWKWTFGINLPARRQGRPD
jgi:hypothetical protein